MVNKKNWFYDLTFKELSDAIDLTPYQRVKLSKWFFGQKHDKKKLS